MTTTEETRDGDPLLADVANGSSAAILFWSKMALAAALSGMCLDLFQLAFAIYENNKMALPGGVLRVMFVGVLATMMRYEFNSAYWILGGLLLLSCLMILPFAFLSFGTGQAVFEFSLLLLTLAVFYFTSGIVILIAVMKRQRLVTVSLPLTVIHPDPNPDVERHHPRVA